MQIRIRKPSAARVVARYFILILLLKPGRRRFGQVYLRAIDKEKVEPCFRLHHISDCSRGKFLEAEFCRELEGARTTGSKDAVRTRRGAVVDSGVVTLFGEGDGRRESQVSYVEDVKDFTDQIEFEILAEAEGLSLLEGPGR